MNKEDKKLEMIELRKQRYTLKEIGQIFGISKQRVSQIIGKVARGEDKNKLKRNRSSRKTTPISPK